MKILIDADMILLKAAEILAAVDGLEGLSADRGSEIPLYTPTIREAARDLIAISEAAMIERR